ncbi:MULTISPECIES: hypothetical protein [Burkholderia]|uniref:hypothetical protein n=1 Tax=Burkholderia TaxID=32008 RepID=UPI0011B1F282|nr:MULTISPECIES: hypothetical protein [Burkholderia]MDN7542315.1 hypothetical protein [Burkholderia cenocepacia]
MNSFVLKKGTIVNHGTSLARLPMILEHGLLRGSEREQGRLLTEPTPESTGIYVGELMAYLAAYAQYSSEVSPHLDHPAVFEAGNHFMAGDHRTIRGIDFPTAPKTLPVVLKIQLGEECPLLADEDFVADGTYPVGEKVPESVLRDEAQRTWARWGSGVLSRDVPPSWIVALEHPRVVTLDNVNTMAQQVFADCELIAAGMMQSYKIGNPADLIEQYKRRYGRLGLSRNIAASAGVEKNILALPGLSSDMNCFVNHFLLFQSISHLSQRYNIPVVRRRDGNVIYDRNGYEGAAGLPQ